jgi:hypothetical protein
LQIISHKRIIKSEAIGNLFLVPEILREIEELLLRVVSPKEDIELKKSHREILKQKELLDLMDYYSKTLK